MCALFEANTQKALELFTKAAELGPGDARYRGNMATALGMLGRYDEALSTYLQIVPPRTPITTLPVLFQANGQLLGKEGVREG